MAANAIDPRLQQYATTQQQSPQQPQQYPPNLDHTVRRASGQPPHLAPPPQQQHPQHLPPSELSTPTPRQPYYHLPRPSLPPQQHRESLDPALAEDESPMQDSDGHPSPDDGSGLTKTPDAKRGRACDSCRGLKVKCDFGENPQPGESCKRCAKARRPCIVTPATRRRQKKADSRVAELERKVDALTQRLVEHGGVPLEEGVSLKHPADSVSPYQQTPARYPPDQSYPGDEHPGKRRRIDPILTRTADSSADERHGASSAHSVKSEQSAPLTGIYNETKAPVFDHSDIDQRVSRIVDNATAERLFDRYVNQFVPRFPAVTFPPGTKAKSVRKKKPILFLAILSSTCFGAMVPRPVQEKLEEALRDVLADAVWKKGEKSLEIIQSLQVATLWYRPPSNFEQHMFYQWVHFSAFMAIDIGVGKRMAPSKRKLFERPWKPAWESNSGLPNPESAEVRRAWLTSYFLCTSISMVLRRPILFRYTDYMRECLEYLESAEDALPSDKILCQQVRLAHIAEDIAVQFALDDPGVSLSISDGKVTYGIKHFEKDLAEVIEKHVTDYALTLSEHITSLYLHEIALHSQSNIEDFKAPFTEDSFRSSSGGQAVLGPQHVDALTACMSACRNILDTFLSYEQDVCYILPVIFCVRCIYATVVLMKMFIAAKSPGEMRNVIKPEELAIETYIERMHNLFKSFMERDSNSPHSKFMFVMERLKTRFSELERGEEGGPPNGRSAGKPNLAQIAAGAQGSTPVVPATGPAQAQGLHLLSEAAMSGNQQQLPPQQQSQPQQQHPQGQGPPQGWYAQPQPGEMPQQMHHMDPNAAAAAYGQYPTEAMATYDGFDYGLGMASVGMDGAISGLFMADGLWNYNQPHGQGQIYPGWS